ncbi:hypothetical protein EEB11_17930 [Pseudotabrizicola sediminis]|uniref:Uncharacterized protein n=1 Tax=Pseudotabrizicola sediminis TaxID=2486418 RepID=A0ABY2KKX7_9RHOB|nr:hypothetical protein EEB11_17930 [Pseudotabrizicola sediminis]
MSSQITRRAVLRGGVSAVVVLGLPTRGAGPMPSVPPEFFQPGIEAMADTVKAIVELLKPSIVGVDPADLRAVLQGAGVGGFGQATIRRKA